MKRFVALALLLVAACDVACPASAAPAAVALRPRKTSEAECSAALFAAYALLDNGQLLDGRTVVMVRQPGQTTALLQIRKGGQILLDFSKVIGPVIASIDVKSREQSLGRSLLLVSARSADLDVQAAAAALWRKIEAARRGGKRFFEIMTPDMKFMQKLEAKTLDQPPPSPPKDVGSVAGTAKGAPLNLPLNERMDRAAQRALASLGRF